MHDSAIDISTEELVSHLFFDECFFGHFRIESIRHFLSSVDSINLNMYGFQVVLLQEDLFEAFADLRRIGKARAAHSNEQRLASFFFMGLEFSIQILGQFPDLDGWVFLNRYKRLNMVTQNFLLFLIKDRSRLILVSSG